MEKHAKERNTDRLKGEGENEMLANIKKNVNGNSKRQQCTDLDKTGVSSKLRTFIISL